MLRRIQAINNTKIKYLSVADKVYEVTSIDWQHSYLEAIETNLKVGDVEESELWDISDFADFGIRLVFGDYGGSDDSERGEIIDFAEWVESRKAKKGKGSCKMNMKK